MASFINSSGGVDLDAVNAAIDTKLIKAGPVLPTAETYLAPLFDLVGHATDPDKLYRLKGATGSKFWSDV